LHLERLRIDVQLIVLVSILREVGLVFTVDPDQRRRWIGAVGREPNENTWICSQHFVTGRKNNDPLAPNYAPSIFKHVPSPVKCTLGARVSDYRRRKGAKKTRMTEISKQQLAKETRQREKMPEAERMEKLKGRSRKTVIRDRHNAEVQQRKSEQLRLARELEEQQAAEMARQFENLKAANESRKLMKS